MQYDERLTDVDMSRHRILIVEDDPAIRTGLVDALTLEGYEVTEAADGEAGLTAALSGGFDLILLDLMLPKRGGLEVLADVRRDRPGLPVIILTARGAESDRVEGLKLGADDYVVKPFSVRELVARVEAVLRRSPERPKDVEELAIPGGRVDFNAGELTFDDGRTVRLSERESALLRFLASNSGRTVTRDEILLRVWRMDPKGIETRTVDMHIARLREKLGDDPSDPKLLRTVRGRGYLFGEEAST